MHYLSLLHEALSPTVNVEILGISHAGFEPDVDHCDKIFTLEEQVKHKIEVTEQFLENRDEAVRDVWIFGHSVGCFIAQRVITESSKDSRFRQGLKFIGLITPTIIDIHKSHKGAKLSSIAQLLPNFDTYVSKLTRIIRIIPNFIIDKAVEFAMRNSTILDSFSITMKFITNENIVKQSLGLAIEEMNEIQDTWDYNLQFMKDLDNKDVIKWFFFTHPDNWVSQETQVEITERLVEPFQGAFVDRDDDIGHSFCIDRSAEFCEITLESLNEVISRVNNFR